MPFIHIKSLPLSSSVEIPAILKGIAADFSGKTGIALKHITVTWDYLQPGHYAAAGSTPSSQPRDTHPILVNLLVPDFNGPDDIARMLNSIAASIAERTGIPLTNVFIHCEKANSGMMFEAGQWVHW